MARVDLIGQELALAGSIHVYERVQTVKSKLYQDKPAATYLLASVSVLQQTCRLFQDQAKASVNASMAIQLVQMNPVPRYKPRLSIAAEVRASVFVYCLGSQLLLTKCLKIDAKQYQGWVGYQKWNT